MNNNTNSDTVAFELFQQITKQQVARLYQLYKYDFELFGYSHEAYVDVAIA